MNLRSVVFSSKSVRAGLLIKIGAVSAFYTCVYRAIKHGHNLTDSINSFSPVKHVHNIRTRTYADAAGG